MRRRALVVILGLFLSVMLVSCASLQKQGGTGELIVRVASSGKIVNAVDRDGKELKYAPEAKDRVVGGRLAFFTEGKKGPQGFLKKINGKWQKAPISEARKGAKVGKGEVGQLIAHIASDGQVLSLTNLDGTRAKLAEGVKPTNLRLVSAYLVCSCSVSGHLYSSCPPCTCAMCKACSKPCN